jgi:hypothetical protein
LSERADPHRIRRTRRQPLAQRPKRRYLPGRATGQSTQQTSQVLVCQAAAVWWWAQAVFSL